MVDYRYTLHYNYKHGAITESSNADRKTKGESV